MKMSKTLTGVSVSILSLSILLASPLAGAEDLSDIYKQAQQSDPSLRAAEAGYRAALQAKPQALAPLKPQITANAGLERHDQTFSDTSATTSAFFRDSDFIRNNYGIRLDQTLYNRSLSQQLKQANSQVDKAEADIVAARQKQILDVTETYFNALSAVDNMEFAGAEKTAIARQLTQSKERFEVGLIAITDVKEAQAQYDLAVAQEIDAKNQYNIAMENVQVLVGHLPTDLQPLSETFAPTSPQPANIEEWVAIALENSLALKAAQHQQAISKAEVSRQKAGHLPTIGLRAEHGVQDDDSGFNEGKSADTILGLQLNLPLYAGGLVKSRTTQAKLTLEQARQQTELQRRVTIRETRAAYLTIVAGISRVKALQQALISTKSAHETAEAGFEVGTRTAVDVLLALRETYRARRDYSRARYDTILQTFRLKQAAGTLSEKDIMDTNDWL